jgi:2-succinyl-5-enolpyruvyl-6-hydroxy-3-cyclohexene-1-carboxylate synthase
LVPTGAPLVDAPGRADGRPWIATSVAPRVADPARFVELVRAHPRGMLVAGWGSNVAAETAMRFATAAGWPVLADPISGLRAGPHAISTYEALLRRGVLDDMRPELAVRIGAPLTSKVTTAWLEHDVPQVVIDPDRTWLDPHRAAAERIEADPEGLLDAVRGGRPSPWLDQWVSLERDARRSLDAVLDDAPEPFEGRIARDLAAALPDGASLVVASSLPVRALEWCMAPRTGLRVLANRGANGIDGFVSTVLGVGAVSHGPTVGFCGDLCFVHDTNGLLAARDSNARFVVVDNDGGGIFSFLPQDGLPEFEQLFGTPHGLDLVAIAKAHGISAARIDGLTDLPEALRAGPQVLVIPVDRAKSVEHHRALWHAVAANRRA